MWEAVINTPEAAGVSRNPAKVTVRARGTRGAVTVESVKKFAGECEREALSGASQGGDENDMMAGVKGSRDVRDFRSGSCISLGFCDGWGDGYMGIAEGAKYGRFIQPKTRSRTVAREWVV
jgi:hypothetical protein